MLNVLDSYKKKKNYLLCVDSDGCVMNTMDIKHKMCFGPCMVTEWNLEQWRTEVLEIWDSINLYSATRGINRFKGLELVLQRINKDIVQISDIETLSNFVKCSFKFSNSAVQFAIEQNPQSDILKRALSWSLAVNEAIRMIPSEHKKPFHGVRETLSFAYKYADIAVISSANSEAVYDEWQMNGLLEYTDVILSQEIGDKIYCISQLLQKGYCNENVLMCGDAPGDLDAAQKNQIQFFPIQFKKEQDSWCELLHEGFFKFLDNTYIGFYQHKMIEEFRRNLNCSEL